WGLSHRGLQGHGYGVGLLGLTAHPSLAFLPEPLAKVERSTFGNHGQTLDAIESIRRKHLSQLPRHLRRRLEAALAMERAAARYRQRDWGRALSAMLKSLWLAPIGNAAIRTVMAGPVRRRLIERGAPPA